ncbi:cytochrome c family protein [Candidatus Pelagibacter sp.]|nr:cytochrome c family protein [Candidatus Pelagibacter sp.]
MDSFELNKIIAAVLLVALLVIGISKISNVIFYVEKPEKPGYAVEIEQVSSASSSSTEKVEEEINITMLMAMGDIASGEKIFKKCAACHSIVKDGKNKIGPALWNVVNRKVGGVSDYKYSKALADYDKEWNFEELNGFLIKPAKWIKGTKMAYAGLRKEKDRASIIKYLNQNSDSPVPLP